jgi:hypothetical protein
MAIPSRQIGWGTEDNLLWQISKQLEQLTNVTAQACTTTTSTSSSTTTTTTTLPVYRVYTALLSQTGGDNPTLAADVPLVLGLSYQIIDNDSGTADFTNVGAPNNTVGTFFSATGTTPTSWGVNTLGQLQFNTGAPTAIVLENTLGNISFEYKSSGTYKCWSDNLFTIDKTTVFISDTINKDNPTDRMQLRVLCAPDKIYQPAYLNIFSGTVSVSYEDDVISDNGASRFAVSFEIRVYN